MAMSQILVNGAYTYTMVCFRTYKLSGVRMPAKHSTTIHMVLCSHMLTQIFRLPDSHSQELYVVLRPEIRGRVL